MNRSMLYLAVSAGVLGACTESPTQPQAVDGTTHPAFAAAAQETPRHVVRFAAAESARIAAAVTALGGRVEFVSEGGGFAGVSGLSPAAVASLAATAGVSDLFEDVIMNLDAASQVGEMEAAQLTSTSVADPAGAFRHAFQWNMRAIGAHTAWAAGELGSSDVTVAILDTGIDYDAYDMSAVIDLERSRSFVPGDDNVIDTFFPGRHHIDDLNGHGTNVATQVSSGGVLFAGVNSRVRLFGVKVLGYNNSGSLAGVLAGLRYAADAGADVANMSLGAAFGISKKLNPGFVELANEAFNYANSQGMVVVVSAGNDGQNMDRQGDNFRPYCEAPHVVCVSATGPTASAHPFLGPWSNQDAGTFYSNTGRQSITVSAPGGTPFGWIASQCAKHAMNVLPNGTFTTPCNAPPGFFVATGFAGTSQAAPHVTGLAAMLVGKHGKNKPAQIRQRLTKSVDDLGPKGRDDAHGWGRINVPRALGL